MGTSYEVAAEGRRGVCPGVAAAAVMPVLLEFRAGPVVNVRMLIARLRQSREAKRAPVCCVAAIRRVDH